MSYDMIKTIKDARARRRMVLQWRTKDKMTVQEIADKLGISIQRAFALLARARRD